MARAKNHFLANLFRSNENFDEGLSDVELGQPIEGVNTKAEAIERIDELKNDNELIEIEVSVEEEIEEIEEASNTVDELTDASEEINEIHESMEAAIERGGLTSQQARIVQLRLSNIDKRLNLNGYKSLASKVSVESFNSGFNSRIQRTISLEEETKSFGRKIIDFILSIWESIKSFFRKLKEKIFSLFDFTKKNIEKTTEKVKSSKKEKIWISVNDSIKIVGEVILDKLSLFDKIFKLQIEGTRFWIEFFKHVAEAVRVETFDADDFSKLIDKTMTSSKDKYTLGGNKFFIVKDEEDDGYKFRSLNSNTKATDSKRGEDKIQLTTSETVAMLSDLKKFYDEFKNEFTKIHKIIDENAEKVKKALSKAEADNDQEQLKKIRLLTKISNQFMSHGLGGTVKLTTRAINTACKVFQLSSDGKDTNKDEKVKN